MKTKLGASASWGLLLFFFFPLKSGLAAEPITAIDCQEKSLPLNPPETYTLVLLGTPKEEEKLRDTGTLFDDQLNRPDFRIVVIVDLSRHPGRFIPIVVRREMQTNLARKRKWLQENHYPPAPSGTYALSSVPDFKGELPKKLGFSEDAKGLRVVLFSPKGEALSRWRDDLDPAHVKRLMP